MVDFSISFFPYNSMRMKLMLVLTIFMCKACFCTETTNGQSGGIVVNGEVAEEIGNPVGSSEKDSFDSFENQDDLKEYKRHMGAIAAMSGSRAYSGSKFIPPSKKHVGSIAAQSPGRSTGRKLEIFIPTYKRHLGSLMALSGFKPKPYTRSLKASSANTNIDHLESSNEWETQKSTDPQTWWNFEAPTNNQIDLIDYPLAVDANAPLHENDLSSPTQSESYDADLQDQTTGFGDDIGAYKTKRFLGPLARGGWFPRHFRGIISENTFGKRHIGALARLGWMPHAKGNSRLNMLDERGELGLKRNDVSPRRKMLYHFTAPSLWTSPRGK